MKSRFQILEFGFLLPGRFQILRKSAANFRFQRKQIFLVGRFQISRKFASRFFQNCSSPKSATTFQISDFEHSKFPIQDFEAQISDFGIEIFATGQ